MATRVFTPATARAALARVGPLAERISDLYRQLESTRAVAFPDGPVDPAYFSRVAEFHRVAGVVRSAGVLIDNPRAGALAFPARRAGRSVLLCWRVGEPAVRHWRPGRRRFEARRPVDENGPWHR